MKLINGIEWGPVAFVPDLVQGILRDEKTETRRIVSGAPHDVPAANCSFLDGLGVIETADGVEKFKTRYGRPATASKPASRLWVREHFAAMRLKSETKLGLNQVSLVESSIDDADLMLFKDNSIKWRTGAIEAKHKFGTVIESIKRWRPPMHLPHWASRIGLEVKRLGLERVQDITEAGAVAEGFRSEADIFADRWHSAWGKFRKIWDEINGNRIDKRSGRKLCWELNPFVWVITFERLKDYGQEKTAL